LSSSYVPERKELKKVDKPTVDMTHMGSIFGHYLLNVAALIYISND